MALIKELKIESIVILAQSFNPSIFNRHWLVKNQFIEEDKILPNSIFAPVVTQIATKNYNLLVVPEQLQFNISNFGVNFEKEIENTLLPIIKRLMEIPYKAVGLNFNWFVQDSEKNINELSKDLFYINDSNIFQYFNTNDSWFGTYMSKNFKNTRLKLDVKPINAQDTITHQTTEHIQCGFNFHRDLSSDLCAEELIETLSNWKVYKTETLKIIDLL